MRIVKKFFSIVLMFSLLTLVGCVDQSWSFKTESNSLASGVYIYSLLNSYQTAFSKATANGSNTEDLLSITIEDKNASDWIKDDAIAHCKQMFAIDKKFEDLGLSLTDEELSTAQSSTDKSWQSLSKRFEEYGISKDSFHKASQIYPLKSQKVFYAMYGKDGTEAVSDEELLKFFKENYVSLSIATKISSDSSEEITESQDSSVTNENVEDSTETRVKGDVEQINSKAKSLNQIKNELKQEEKSESDPFHTQEIYLDNLSDQFKEPAKNLEVGKATYVSNQGTYFLFYKNDISQKLPDLSSETKRNEILQNMKSKDFDNMLNEVAEQLNVSVNNGVINKFKPSMFKI